MTPPQREIRSAANNRGLKLLRDVGNYTITCSFPLGGGKNTKFSAGALVAPVFLHSQLFDGLNLAGGQTAFQIA
jgi:hypothetical protein